MDPLKLGFRNLLGITVPGALLVLALIYCVISMTAPLGWPNIARDMLKEQGILAITVFFIISYVFGSLIRLRAADSVDRKSTARFRSKYPDNPETLSKPESDEERLHKMLESIASGRDEGPWRKDLIDWVYSHDEFPYPVWEFMKFRLYHPHEMFKFYQSYRNCFGTKERRAKEFFNYCKMVVYSISRSKGDGLADEIQAAEGYTRFYAGSYHAFWLAAYALVICDVAQWLEVLNKKTSMPHAVATLVLAFVAAAMARTVIAGGRFRLFRLKEVDMVFDAFYLVHRHANDCAQCAENSAQNQSENYGAREWLVRDAFSFDSEGKSISGPIMLPRLLGSMRQWSGINDSLSCIYFAGARGDHPYFLKTDKLAIGVSVLPEDSKKAGISKKHLHQHEAIFVIEGQLRLEIKESSGPVQKLLKVGEMVVIQPGQCHCITPVEGSNASYVFVKTNPAMEPMEENC
jgi:mannose-6-phosphate isomerase-like protein (cupin superfamily)